MSSRFNRKTKPDPKATIGQKQKNSESKSKSKSVFNGLHVSILITCALVLERLVFRDLGTNILPETTVTSTSPRQQQLRVREQKDASTRPAEEQDVSKRPADEQDFSTGSANETIPKEVIVGSTTIGPSDYPYMPWDMLSECGLTNASDSSLLLSLLQPKPLNQSLAFIKPYKVGSSTVANLVNRWADYRDFPRIVPKPAWESVMGKTGSGKPDTFPGKIIPTVPVGVKYRALTNHAVFFNRSLLSKYMEDPITTFTIMREPLSRVKSAYRFFSCGSGGYKLWTNSESLKQYPHLEKWGDYHRVQKWNEAVCGNSLAYSLGWYHQNNFTTQYDRDVDKIEAFIKKLDAEMDMVMMLDRLEESLLLLRDILPGLAVSELVYNRFKDNRKGQIGTKSDIVPTESEMKELEDILLVDKMIYNHFNKRFDEQWKSLVRRSPDIESIKQSLVCLQGKVEANMGNTDVLHEDLIEYLTLDSKYFTMYSKEKQVKKLRKQVENGMQFEGKTLPPTSGTSSGTTTDNESDEKSGDEAANKKSNKNSDNVSEPLSQTSSESKETSGTTT